MRGYLHPALCDAQVFQAPGRKSHLSGADSLCREPAVGAVSTEPGKRRCAQVQSEPEVNFGELTLGF